MGDNVLTLQLDNDNGQTAGEVCPEAQLVFASIQDLMLAFLLLNCLERNRLFSILFIVDATYKQACACTVVNPIRTCIENTQRIKVLPS